MSKIYNLYNTYISNMNNEKHCGIYKRFLFITMLVHTPHTQPATWTTEAVEPFDE